MSFVLRSVDRDILKNRLGLSPTFLRRLEAVLEQGDDSATDLSVDDLTATKSVVAGTTITATGAITGSALSDANGNVKPFKRYIALVSQTSTSAPTATVLLNELGVTPTFGYTSPGLFTITATGKWTSAKTAIQHGPQSSHLDAVNIVRTSADVLTISTKTLSESSNVLIATATNALLTAYLVDVKVFD